MTFKPKFLTQLPKTKAMNEVHSFFMPGIHKRLLEARTYSVLKAYSEKVFEWNSIEGAKIDKPEFYDKTPFSADKRLYTYLRLWHTIGTPKGEATLAKFKEYVDEAKDGTADFPLSAPTAISRPLHLLLKCAWNLADERGSGTATNSVEADGMGMRAVFKYTGISPYSDNILNRFRPSPMKLIEEFADFLGGKATVESHGFIHSIIIEMPMAKEKKE